MLEGPWVCPSRAHIPCQVVWLSVYTVFLPLLASLSRSAHSNSPGSLACQFMAIPLSAFFKVSRELAYTMRDCKRQFRLALSGRSRTLTPVASWLMYVMNAILDLPSIFRICLIRLCWAAPTSFPHRPQARIRRRRWRMMGGPCRWPPSLR
jgi:hypothetical protein